jgi:hypothetical protein
LPFSPMGQAVVPAPVRTTNGASIPFRLDRNIRPELSLCSTKCWQAIPLICAWKALREARTLNSDLNNSRRCERFFWYFAIRRLIVFSVPF